jgi:hypothetical protein
VFRTQDLTLGWQAFFLLEPLQHPFIIMGFLGDRMSPTIFLGLASNHDANDLCLLRS